jgi:hypothetical protein
MKKLMLAIIAVLAITMQSHAAPQPGDFTYTPKPNNTLRDFVGLLALTALYKAAPKIDKYIEEHAATLNEEELKKFVIRINRVVFAMYVAIGIYTVVAFYPMFKDLYDYCYPSEAKKAAIKAATERLKFFKAEDDFIDCLLGNRQTARNDAGLPTVCEKFGDTYRAIAGQEKFDDMTVGLARYNY